LRTRPVSGARARQQNLAGAFRLRGPIKAGTVVIVDDLVTTGSSLTEAARVLRAAGMPVLGAATVAATVRLSPEFGGTEKSVRIPGSGRNTG
jgi:predicted amidophosphoribosyltransferase